jgi:hypothetical protein
MTFKLSLKECEHFAFISRITLFCTARNMERNVGVHQFRTWKTEKSWSLAVWSSLYGKTLGKRYPSLTSYARPQYLTECRPYSWWTFKTKRSCAAYRRWLNLPHKILQAVLSYWACNERYRVALACLCLPFLRLFQGCVKEFSAWDFDLAFNGKTKNTVIGWKYCKLQVNSSVVLSCLRIWRNGTPLYAYIQSVRKRGHWRARRLRASSVQYTQ